jgi:hypothetical protein
MAIAVAFPDKTFSFDGRNIPTSELNTMRPSLTFIGLKTISANTTDMGGLRTNNVKYKKNNAKRDGKEDQTESTRRFQKVSPLL